MAEEYEIRYFGSGGLTQAYLGLAHRWEGKAWRQFYDADGNTTDSVRIITSGTAVGGRFEQVFGGMERSRTINIANPIYIDTRVQTAEDHRNAGFTLGFVREQLVAAAFDKDRKLVSSSLLRVGGVFRLGRNHTINRDTRWSSWQTLSSGPVGGGLGTHNGRGVLLQASLGNDAGRRMGIQQRARCPVANGGGMADRQMVWFVQ